MSLSSPTSFLLHQKLHKPSNPSASGVSLYPRLKIVSEASTACLQYEGTKERIKKMFDRVELSVSSYDTAWVAMVPSPNYPETPCFPDCVNWLLDNQLDDGSWGLLHRDPLLIKDALSSTLACVLALKRWGIGEEQINKGLHFIKSNFDSSTDEKLHSPIGFDIIFPGMIEYGKALNLNLHLGPTVLDDMLYKRDLELKSCGSSSDGRNAYLAYVSEGIGNLRLHDWKMVMKYQRKNGSLFNSPSTTAAALIHLRDPGCLDYLRSVLNMFGNAVPTVYPLDIFARLSMVDNLVRLGIDQLFKEEIRSVLDMTYRSWLQKDEEIFSDLSTCAMAFRILRLNGYDVSPDPLTQLSDGDHYFASFSGHPKDMHAALELFRASEIIIYPDESALEKTNSTSSKFLKQELLNASIPENKFTKKLRQQVDDALKFRHYADLERLENRRYIKHYNADSTRIQKTSYCSPNISNEDFLKLAVEDFNICQSIHRGELKELARWIVDSRLDQLKFARQKLAYCYFSGAATLFSPESKDARISWAKNGVLTTVVDDFFDVGGSEEELVNLTELVKKWDVNLQTDCCSDQVVILFSALHNTISEIDDRAVTCQGRSVKSHIIEIWLDLLNSMLREADWARNKFVPTMDEYMTNAYVSMALGPIVLPALYLVGPKLSDEVVRTPEYHNLFKLMSTCGRLLNDFQGYKREIKQGKLNAVTLRMIHSGGLITEEDGIKEIKSTIESNRRELLRLVLQEKNSVVPRTCKDLFWKMSKVVHLFYVKDDGFTSDEMINDVKEVMYEPIVLQDL